ncbi:MAG: BlaI/MecI/CopY family transcriptional regulator [Phycisphaerales bacterium]
MARQDPDIGEAELETLKVLWDRGRSTVRDVMNALHEQGRDVAYTTVQTTLTRLEQKGVVSSNKSGLSFVYRARVSRDRIARARLERLIEQLFDGVPGSLVLQLMKTERFSPDELAAFQKLIEDLDADRE